jgi:hypothetical protein
VKYFSRFPSIGDCCGPQSTRKISMQSFPRMRFGDSALDPSDFLLFGYIKGKLSDFIYESRDDLLNAITGVDQEVLPSVFESWVNRRR